MSGADIVRVEGVQKRYGPVEAVREASFALQSGETVALVGHNGAGKTTLMKMMLGLIRPTSGLVRVMGEAPDAGEFSARRRLGYLPENVSFNSALTGQETLAFYARLKGESPARCCALLDRVGLGQASSRRVATYSKGMRQRLGLAQALLGQPRVLLLDEPTTGLDPALRLSFYEIVDELRRDGATVLLSSHALTELEERAGRVIIMNRGLKVADGTLDDLRRLARLPTRIRLSLPADSLSAVPEGIVDGHGWRKIDGRILEIDAEQDDKVALLRRITSSDIPIQDIELTPPSLDDLYAHFLRAQEPVS